MTSAFDDIGGSSDDDEQPPTPMPHSPWETPRRQSASPQRTPSPTLTIGVQPEDLIDDSDWSDDDVSQHAAGTHTQRPALEAEGEGEQRDPEPQAGDEADEFLEEDAWDDAWFSPEDTDGQQEADVPEASAGVRFDVAPSPRSVAAAIHPGSPRPLRMQGVRPRGDRERLPIPGTSRGAPSTSTPPAQSQRRASRGRGGHAAPAPRHSGGHYAASRASASGPSTRRALWMELVLLRDVLRSRGSRRSVGPRHDPPRPARLPEAEAGVLAALGPRAGAAAGLPGRLVHGGVRRDVLRRVAAARGASRSPAARRTEQHAVRGRTFHRRYEPPAYRWGCKRRRRAIRGTGI